MRVGYRVGPRWVWCDVGQTTFRHLSFAMKRRYRVISHQTRLTIEGVHACGPHLPRALDRAPACLRTSKQPHAPESKIRGPPHLACALAAPCFSRRRPHVMALRHRFIFAHSSSPHDLTLTDPHAARSLPHSSQVWALPLDQMF